MPNISLVRFVLVRLSLRLSLLPVVLAGLLLPAGALAQANACGCANLELFVSAPSTVSAGVPFNMTVYTEGSDGTPVTNFGLWMDYYSTDPDAIIPVMEATSLPGGTATFPVVLQTPGMQTISLLDEDLETGSVSINVTASSYVTGSQRSVRFGSLPIGTPSTAQAVNFSIVSPGNTVGSIAVLTQGAASMDFTEAAGSTCAATTYYNFNCTVNVVFTPKAAGLRLGAVVFYSGAGNTGMQLASVPIYGVGTGPQVAYGPGTATDIDPTVGGSSLNYPLGVAVDALGDLFIADQFRVVGVPAGGGAATAISPTVGGNGLNLSWGLAVDGAGDVLIANTYWCLCSIGDAEPGGPVMVAPSGGGYARAIDAGFYYPTDAAVDGAGDVFVADSGNNRVVEVAAGGATTTIDPIVNSLGLGAPYGVALDSAGDLFIADTGYNRVVKVPAAGGPATAIAPTVNGVAMNGPIGIAVDAAGDLFVADSNNNRVVEIPAGGGAAVAIAPVVNGLGLNSPQGIAVDATGNLFIADANNNRVVEIERAQPPEVIFTTATAVGSTDTKDGTQTVEIENIGNEALDLTALSYPTDFPQAGGAAIPCTGSISLSAGEACDLPIEFAPTSLGPSLSEDVMLTDNEFNGTGVKQSIVVEGMTGSTPHTLYIPAPGTVLKGPEVTFVWSDTAGAVSYSLWIGSKGVGSSNVYDSGAISATTVKIGGLPTNGETLHGRVNAIFSKGSAHSDFTYPAATQAAITAPGAGTTLAGPSVTFTWSAATGASGYSLWLGSTGPGSHDLYVSHETTGTSANATGLPVNGETIYARLFTTYGNATVYSDSTFKAQ